MPALAASLTELVAAVDMPRQLSTVASSQLGYLLFRISRASSNFILLHLLMHWYSIWAHLK